MRFVEGGGFLRGGDEERADDTPVDEKGTTDIVMETATTHETTRAAVPPACRAVKMESIDRAPLGDDVIQHGIYSPRAVELAIAFVEKIARREASRNKLQAAGASEQVETHSNFADERIRLAEQCVSQRLERAAVRNGKGGATEIVRTHFGSSRCPATRRHAHSETPSGCLHRNSLVIKCQ